MRPGRRKEYDQTVRLFQAIGRASLAVDIQNSHSGNMAVIFREPGGREIMAVTATGSQKGDLEAEDIRFLPMKETDYQSQGASRESLVHARVLNLKDVRASLHAHAKDLTIITLDDEPKPHVSRPFIPVDPLGFFYLKGLVPVEWMEVPSGSPEMAEVVSSRLALSPAVVIQAHGTFTRGRTLEEAFFHACLANNSAYIIRLLEKLKVDVESLRAEAQARPEFYFDPRLSVYEIGGRVTRWTHGEDGAEFVKASARLFESRLSPFHTGSASMRFGENLLFAPQASRPRDIGGPLRRLPLGAGKGDSFEAGRHKALYAAGDFRALLHCYLPEAEALARGADPDTGRPAERLTAIDAEGRYLYSHLPIVAPGVETAELGRLIAEHPLVVVRGGGVWASGQRALSEALHHLSSLRDICLYRIGALERGLDLRIMELARS